jgi:PX domain
MSKEEIAAVVKRTAEIMGVFTASYMASFFKESISGTIEGCMETVMSELKDNVLPVSAEEAADAADAKALEEEYAGAEGIVGVCIAERHSMRDVDSSVFTAYDINAAYAHPIESKLSNYTTRYSALHKFNKKLRKTLDKHEFPDAKFPPKKLFGNMDEEFLRKRTAALDGFLSELSATDAVALNEEFLKGVQLVEDENKAFDMAVFVGAFNATTTFFDIQSPTAPEEFEEEVSGMIVLMLDVVDREVMPAIEKRIDEKIPTPGRARNFALRAARKAISQAVGKAVRKAWDVAEDKINQGKDKMRDLMESKQEIVNNTVTSALQKLVPKILEKCNKEETAPAEEKHAGDKDEIEIRIEATRFGKTMIEAVSDSSSDEIVRNYASQFRSEVRMQRRMERTLEYQMDAIGDAQITYTLRQVSRMINGVIEFWLKHATLVLEGLQFFYAFKDELEAKAATDEVKEVVERLKSELKAHVRSVGLKLAKLFHDQSLELTRDLHMLPADVASSLREALLTVPEGMLNFFAGFYFKFSQAADKWVADGVKAETATDDIREMFINCGLAPFNLFFSNAWQTIADAVFDAARGVLVAKVFDVISDMVDELGGAIADVIPDALASVFDVAALVSAIIENVLDKIAFKALHKLRTIVEKRVFADDASEHRGSIAGRI